MINRFSVRTRPRPRRGAAARWRVAAAAGALMVAALVPGMLMAHVVVYPRSSTPGAYERYELRVPNEKDVATIRVELRVPDSVRVTSFEDVLGWRLDVQMDSAKRVVGATWTGTLPPGRFVEFPFIAVNPKHGASIAWAAYQTYVNGQRVAWTGAEGSATPASVTVIGTQAQAQAEAGGSSHAQWYAIAASLVLSLIALGIAAQRRADS